MDGTYSTKNHSKSKREANTLNANVCNISKFRLTRQVLFNSPDDDPDQFLSETTNISEGNLSQPEKGTSWILLLCRSSYVYIKNCLTNLVTLPKHILISSSSCVLRLTVRSRKKLQELKIFAKFTNRTMECGKTKATKRRALHLEKESIPAHYNWK